MFKSILEILKVFIELEFFEEGRDMGEKEGARVWRGFAMEGVAWVVDREGCWTQTRCDFVLEKSVRERVKN